MINWRKNRIPFRDRYARLLVFLTGLLALVWFLVRVIPKPYRAAYPCQRAAFPLASAFVLWLTFLFTSSYLVRRGKLLLSRKRAPAAVFCLFLAVLTGTASWVLQPSSPTLAASGPSNEPLGVAVGVQPGRVVWHHNPEATDWAGPGDGHWWEPEHTSQTVVDHMLARSVRSLAGCSDNASAWDAMIRYFNVAHNRGDVGYQTGEKIMIKVNLVGCHYLPGWGGVDATSYDLTTHYDYMNTSPQVMRSLLHQLVNVVGVTQSDITIGDPLAFFPNQYHDLLVDEFPNINYLDHEGGTTEHPRVAAQNSTVGLYWSSHPEDCLQDYVLESYVQATYFINLANFKSHSGAGVTLCAKNHYGSFLRYPAEEGYLDLHPSLAYVASSTASYRTLVDLMGHDHLGGKTLLYLIDGLYSGCHPQDSAPQRWLAEPFADDWTSSLFLSQDPVAIESVCYDLMQLEGDSRLYPQMAGVEDHLHEAALAFNPPSGTFYDPNHLGDIERLPSLGVHEHWNDAVNMQYSRNLGLADGIELVRLSQVSDVPVSRASLAVTAYPNPFNPKVNISFKLPEAGQVKLSIYDLAGKRVAIVIDQHMAEGDNEVSWFGLTDVGQSVPSGIYYYRLETDIKFVAGKVTLVR